jgi:DNA-directed RNA polymerase subunit RPC12/RpoP
MKHYDYDSIKNFVQREVITNISDMAEHLFSWEGDKYANWDEWENLYITRCPECGEVVTEPEWEEVEAEDAPNGEGYKCPHCSTLHNEKPEAEIQEIYEYWIVSPWLGKRLRDKGEPVLERWGGWIWGRTCTGQMIFLDGVISAICYETRMENIAE